MVHKPYDINTGGCFDIQHGDGFHHGFRFQRGYGQRGRGVLGNLGRAFKRFIPWARERIAPIAKEALKALADEGLDAGQQILSNIQQGQDPKEAVVSAGTQALKKLVRKAGTRMQQAGSGRKRKKPAKAKPNKRRRSVKDSASLSHLHAIGRSVLEKTSQKNRRAKTLGIY